LQILTKFGSKCEFNTYSIPLKLYPNRFSKEANLTFDIYFYQTELPSNRGSIIPFPQQVSLYGAVNFRINRLVIHYKSIQND